MSTVLASTVASERLPSDRGIRAWISRGAGVLGKGVEWGLGVLSLIVGLSILATIPVAQFASLGYLLESSGRVARSGRLRDGVIGARLAARLGGAAVATWLLLQPLRLLIESRYSAQLLEPGRSMVGWNIAVAVLGTLTVGHIGSATLRGARWRQFIWPAPLRLWRTLRRPRLWGYLYRDARDRWTGFVARLRLPYYLYKGMRGCLIAITWLVVPTSLMVIAARLPLGLGLLVALLGGMGLSIVLVYLPFLQANFAKTDQMSAGFEWRRVREQFRRAPIAFWFALFFTLLLALPLYILKAELIPRDAAWIPSIVFVVSIFPARVLVGWALSRADRHHSMRHWLARWTSRLAFVPVLVIYALVVYATQFVSWYGTWSLYEQHAFLLPVPFLGF